MKNNYFNLVICLALMSLPLFSKAVSITASELDEPETLCFDKTIARGDLSQRTFDYNFVVNEEDFGKRGLVFVGFRLRSNPDKVLLMHGYSEINSRGWTEYVPGQLLPEGAGIWLSAVNQIDILHTPTNLSEFEDDGEILVGYGLRIYEDDSNEDIFQEMLLNERFSVVHRLGEQSVSAYRVCVEIIRVEEVFTAIDIID